MITFKWKSIGSTARKVAAKFRENHGRPNTGVINANKAASITANPMLNTR